MFKMNTGDLYIVMMVSVYFLSRSVFESVFNRREFGHFRCRRSVHRSIVRASCCVLKISHQSRCRENTVALETNVSGIWLSTYSQVIIFHSILMIMADWWSVSCLQGKNSFSKHSISSCRHKQIPGQEVKCLQWLMASLMLKKCSISCFMSVLLQPSVLTCVAREGYFLLTWTNQIVFGRFQNTRREVWFTLICCFFFKLRLVESNSCASPETASLGFSVNFVVTDSWPTLIKTKTFQHEEGLRKELLCCRSCLIPAASPCWALTSGCIIMRCFGPERVSVFHDHCRTVWGWFTA